MIFPQNGVRRDEAGDGAGGGGDAVEPDLATLQAELAAAKTKNTELEAQRGELDKSARYWHEQAQGKKAPAKEAEAAAVDENEEDPIEVLSKRGMKGLDELIAKRGFVRADDVSKTVDAKASQIAAENKLAIAYPDLLDDKSEFFKATAVEYGGLLKQGVPPNVAMTIAAQQAELKGYQSGKRLSTPEKLEREARAKAASGDKGTKAAATEADDELDPFQKYLCEQMEITPEQYKQRAKDGVRVGGQK